MSASKEDIDGRNKKEDFIASQTDGDANSTNLLRFFEISKEIDDIYSYIARWSGLPESSYWVMFSVSDGKSRPKGIAQQCSMRKQTVNSALQYLQQHGYITLQVSADDKRGKNALLTRKGKTFITEKIDVIKDIELNAFTTMGEAKVEGLLAGISGFYAEFSKQTQTLTNRIKNKKRSSEEL